MAASQDQPSRASISTHLNLSPLSVDIAFAVVIFIASIVNLANQDGSGVAAIPVVGFVMLALSSVALVWRRRFSLVALGAALAMTVIWVAAEFPGNPVFLILASLYAVGRYFRGVRINVVALATALGVATLGQVVDGDSVSDIVTGLAVTALPWYVGRRVRVRGDYAAALRERRVSEAHRTIADARSAIARELHDVVAHNVSVMTIQAGVARLVVADDPERAHEAIVAVEEAGREALDELRSLLGVLRPETGSEDIEPQPSLHQIHRLMERLGRTGMDIALSIDVTSELPVRLDLFAYRIVQEALTNVLKHAGADAATRVRLEEEAGVLEIEVTDTGMGTTTLLGSGQGIVGMQERASLLGGTFEAGPQPGGGFRVLARLPIGDQ